MGRCLHGHKVSQLYGVYVSMVTVGQSVLWVGVSMVTIGQSALWVGVSMVTIMTIGQPAS